MADAGTRRRYALRSIGAAAAMMAALAVASPAGAAPGAATQMFSNCDEARAAGFGDATRGQPGYSEDLDRDSDGVSCESDDSGDAGASAPSDVLGSQQTPTTAAPTAPPAPPPAPAAPPAPQPEQLADTGTSAWVLSAVAAALVGIGVYAIRAGYARLHWIGGSRDADVRFTIERDRRR